MTSITQRGNRRLDVFHCDSQRRGYLHLLGQYAAERGLVIRAYCLMTNQTASPRLCRPMHPPCGRATPAAAPADNNVRPPGRPRKTKDKHENGS